MFRRISQWLHEIFVFMLFDIWWNIPVSYKIVNFSVKFACFIVINQEFAFFFEEKRKSENSSLKCYLWLQFWLQMKAHIPTGSDYDSSSPVIVIIVAAAAVVVFIIIVSSSLLEDLFFTNVNMIQVIFSFERDVILKKLHETTKALSNKMWAWDSS